MQPDDDESSWSSTSSVSSSGSACSSDNIQRVRADVTLEDGRDLSCELPAGKAATLLDALHEPNKRVFAEDMAGIPHRVVGIKLWRT